MEIYTDTPLVQKARENIIEALLQYHPLDCPICDQGGECDLQDQSRMFASQKSRIFVPRRPVADKYCGPLIKTIMTRCIHCTRCVRYSNELAGVEFFGTLNRGSSTEIGPYLQSYFDSEVSGNVIDLCPVGALTSKMYAFRVRPWDLNSVEAIDFSDSVGSNIYYDVSQKHIYRVIPRINSNINLEWIHDKIRFFHDSCLRYRIKHVNADKYSDHHLTRFNYFLKKGDLVSRLLNTNLLSTVCYPRVIKSFWVRFLNSNSRRNLLLSTAFFDLRVLKNLLKKKRLRGVYEMAKYDYVLYILFPFMLISTLKFRNIFKSYTFKLLHSFIYLNVDLPKLRLIRERRLKNMHVPMPFTVIEGTVLNRLSLDPIYYFTFEDLFPKKPLIESKSFQFLFGFIATLWPLDNFLMSPFLFKRNKWGTGNFIDFHKSFYHDLKTKNTVFLVDDNFFDSLTHRLLCFINDVPFDKRRGNVRLRTAARTATNFYDYYNLNNILNEANDLWSSFLSLGFCPRVEAPTYNIRLRAGFLKKGWEFFSFGGYFNSTYKSNMFSMDNSFLLNIFKGKQEFKHNFSTESLLPIIVGNSFLNRFPIESVQTFINSLSKNFFCFYIPTKPGSVGDQLSRIPRVSSSDLKWSECLVSLNIDSCFKIEDFLKTITSSQRISSLASLELKEQMNSPMMSTTLNEFNVLPFLKKVYWSHSQATTSSEFFSTAIVPFSMAPESDFYMLNFEGRLQESKRASLVTTPHTQSFDKITYGSCYQSNFIARLIMFFFSTNKRSFFLLNTSNPFSYFFYHFLNFNAYSFKKFSINSCFNMLVNNILKTFIIGQYALKYNNNDFFLTSTWAHFSPTLVACSSFSKSSRSNFIL